MGNIIRKIFINRSTRLLLLLFFTLLTIVGYFIVSTYFSQLNLHKERVFNKLQAISQTLGSQINGKQLEYLLLEYPNKNDITTVEQDAVYKEIHQLLSKAQEGNNIHTDIYTLTLIDSSFYFGVNSSYKAYYRHKFKEFPKELLDKYSTGGLLDFYKSENGTWISAITPIRNSKGEIVGIVQIDEQFNEFLNNAKSKIYLNISISLAIFILIIFFMIRAMRKILNKENELTVNLIESKYELEKKNKETADSINYAKTIQDSILPLKSNIYRTFKDSFVLFLPKDIVSGDFYWFKKIGNNIYLAAADCTGHGVPGALMSMIGNTLLNDIVSREENIPPSKILELLNLEVISTLKQNNKLHSSKDGMDIALCSIDKKNNILYYSGAYRPLYIIRKKELIIIKANSFSIGGFDRSIKEFTNHKVQLLKGDIIYLFSDGFADQFGGDHDKKYLIKKFKGLLLEIHTLDMQLQKEFLLNEFHNWKGNQGQIDDILIFAIKI